MRTHSDQHPRSLLKTATGIADPVLLRLSTGQGVLVLLASDMTYDKAGAMRLRLVRWARNRAMRELFSTNRPPITGQQPELQLRQIVGGGGGGGAHWVGTLHQQAIFRAPAARRGLQMTNLSHDHYLALRAATTRRLLTAGNQLTPRRTPVATALLAFHRAKAALKRVAVHALVAKPA